MSITVCLAANTLSYPQGGGHLWIFLNWALGLRGLGCRVVWLETVAPSTSAIQVQSWLTTLKSHLTPYALAESVALCSRTDESLPRGAAEGCLDLEAAAEADLLLNLSYGERPDLPGHFRRSAMIDIDPGLLQIWITQGDLVLPQHDVYFSISEVVGQPGPRFPDCELKWHYTPPCVALDWWPACRASEDAPFTTVSHWSTDEWIDFGGELYHNDKRSGFLPFLDLPRQVAQPLELALCLQADENLRLADHEAEEQRTLQQKGWRVRHAHAVTATPWDFQSYLQSSRGEFSCAKPSYVHLQTTWLSDRTPCYLASGKPAIVQHTGPSRFLPDAAGLFRFRDVLEAAHYLETASADYEHHCRLARSLAEEYFDARKVARRVLERALN